MYFRSWEERKRNLVNLNKKKKRQEEEKEDLDDFLFILYSYFTKREYEFFNATYRIINKMLKITMEMNKSRRR